MMDVYPRKIVLKMVRNWEGWVAQSTLDFSSDQDLKVVGSSSAMGSALSTESAQVSLSLPLSSACVLLLSLSLSASLK